MLLFITDIHKHTLYQSAQAHTDTDLTPYLNADTYTDTQ
jgi:hypothetical protein